jgi:hypothetical protein
VIGVVIVYDATVIVVIENDEEGLDIKLLLKINGMNMSIRQK